MTQELFFLNQEGFYTIFIINKFKHKNIKYIKEFLYYIISLKFPQSEGLSDFLFFSQSILWMKSYEDIINEIFRIFDGLFQTIPDLLLSIQNYIENKIVDYSNEKNNEEYKKIINEPFYLLIEAILITIHSSFNEISELNEEKTHIFQTLKSTLQVIFQIKNSLKIVIRSIYLLSQIVKISEGLKLIKQRSFEKINQFIIFIYFFFEILNHYSLIFSNDVNICLEKYFDFLFEKDFKTLENSLIGYSKGIEELIDMLNKKKRKIYKNELKEPENFINQLEEIIEFSKKENKLLLFRNHLERNN